MRVFLYISYNGSSFCGFAPQPNKNTVLDKIIEACMRLSITSLPVGSGRTDSGVHASNQVVHLDLPPFWSDLTFLKNTLNSHLHPHIHIKKIVVVDESLHARFSAKQRLYRYICYDGEFNPFLSDLVHFQRDIDIDMMKKLLILFEGEHDFSYFKKSGTLTKDSIRTIYKTRVYGYKNFIIFTFLGNGFLRSQIRLIMGALLSSNEDKEESIKEQIDCKKRVYTKKAPSCGLYLSRIFY